MSDAIKLNYAFDTAIRNAFSSNSIEISEGEECICKLFSVKPNGYYDVRIRYNKDNTDYSVKFEILNNIIMTIKSNFEGKYRFKNNILSLILPVGTYQIYIDIEYAYDTITSESFIVESAGDISTDGSFSTGVTIPKKLSVTELDSKSTDISNLEVTGSLNVTGNANFETLSVKESKKNNEYIEIDNIDSCKTLSAESINIENTLTSNNITTTNTLNVKRYR